MPTSLGTLRLTGHQIAPDPVEGVKIQPYINLLMNHHMGGNLQPYRSGRNILSTR